MRLKSWLIMCVMLLFSAMPVLAAGPTFDMGTVSGTPGTQVTVPVTLTNVTGTSIAALSIDIAYDTTQLSVPMNSTGTSPIAATRGAAITVTDENGDPIKNIAQSIPSSGVLRLGIEATNTILIGNGVVVNVKFNVLAGASGALTLTNTPGASSPTGTPVVITGTAGKINLPVIPPSITAFTIPATGTALDVTFTTLTGSANTVAYLISDTATKPTAADARWVTAKPTKFTFTTFGAKTLYAWAKDKDGNLSTAAVTAATTLTEPAATVNVFAIPATVYSSTASATVTITTFTASANAVAYLITESATAPAASAITAATAPATFTITGLGNHTLYAWVKNASGAVSASKSATTSFSTKPAPVLTVNMLADKSVTNNNTLNITGTVVKNSATGSGNVAGLTINATAVTLDATTGAFNKAVTLTEGSNTITLIASDDQVPPVTATVTRTITLDTTAPALTVTAPVNNSQTNVAGITVTGTVNEASTTVEVSLNGGAVQNATMTTTGFSLPLTLVEGDNTISLIATDAATNKSSATLIKVKLDSVKPTLAVTDPAADITTSLGSYLVKGTSNEGTTVEFKVNGVAVTPAPVITAGAFEKSVALQNPTDKAYAISVKVTDAAGNFSTVQRNINFHALGIADALKALRISVGIDTKTAADNVLDVAPLLNGKPKGDGAVDAADAGVILRKVAGFETW